MNRTLSPFAIILLLATSSCEEKSDDKTILEGTYSGTFTNWNNDPAANTVILSGQTTVTFTNNTYTSTGNDNKIPAGGSGTFKIEENFVNFVDRNVWTANFDWNLILNGSYTYSMKGDSLFLLKTLGYNHYQYELKRKNN